MSEDNKELHIVTQETLDANPSLKEQGIKVGDKIKLGASSGQGSSKSENKKPTGDDTGEMVEVSAIKLNKMMDRLDRLEAAANKKQLARFDARTKGKGERIINLRTWEGKVIMSWDEMPRNIVEKDPRTGYWKEDQIVRLTLEDSEKPIDIPYPIYARRYQLMPATVKAASKDEKTGKTTYKLVTEDGKEYSILDTFVN